VKIVEIMSGRKMVSLMLCALFAVSAHGEARKLLENQSLKISSAIDLEAIHESIGLSERPDISDLSEEQMRSLSEQLKNGVTMDLLKNLELSEKNGDEDKTDVEVDLNVHNVDIKRILANLADFGIDDLEGLSVEDIVALIATTGINVEQETTNEGGNDHLELKVKVDANTLESELGIDIDDLIDDEDLDLDNLIDQFSEEIIENAADELLKDTTVKYVDNGGDPKTKLTDIEFNLELDSLELDDMDDMDDDWLELDESLEDELDELDDFEEDDNDEFEHIDDDKYADMTRESHHIILPGVADPQSTQRI